MILPSKSSIRKTIVDLLASNQAVSADWLHKQVERNYSKCSIQAIYKELRKLLELGVVVKTANTYGLSLPWILESMSFLDAAYDAYLSDSNLLTQLPKNTRRTWRFNDLMRADDFWIQALVAMLNSTEHGNIFGWVPHPWFSIIHQAQDVRFQKILKRMNRKLYLMVGGNYFLDRYYSSAWPTDSYPCSHNNSVFGDKQGSYYNLAGDLLLTVKLDSKLTTVIEDIFCSVKTVSDISPSLAIDLVNARGRIQITLERDTNLVRKLAKRFLNFW